MPLYEYECIECGKNHEVIQKFSDKPLSACPECGGEVKKLISNTSFVLKGTGWYVTDYASPEKKKEQKSGTETSVNASSETKSESKNSEPKSEAKKETVAAKQD